MEYQVRAENLPTDEFLRAYLEAAEWADVDEEDREAFEEAESPKWDEDSLKKAAEDCRRFQELNAVDLVDMEPSQAGHDFYLTRCGHGVGFWARGLGELGDRLTKSCKTFGEVWVTYEADEETLYLG